MSIASAKRFSWVATPYIGSFDPLTSVIVPSPVGLRRLAFRFQ